MHGERRTDRILQHAQLCKYVIVVDTAMIVCVCGGGGGRVRERESVCGGGWGGGRRGKSIQYIKKATDLFTDTEIVSYMAIDHDHVKKWAKPEQSKLRPVLHIVHGFDDHDIALYDVADYDWETWGEWSVCNATCGGGQRSRSRRCVDSVSGSQDQSQCTGNGEQTESCNTHTCAST